MTLKIKYITNAVHAVLVLTVLASVFVVLSASASASVSIQIDDASAESGSTATTPITINSMTNFGAATVTLSYDPSVVQITDVTAGDVGDPTENIDNTAGTATIAAYVSTVTGPDSPITFANIELLAVGGDGEASPLTLTVTTLADADGNSIDATPMSGVFVVGTVEAEPSQCYIATATYGTPLDKNIDLLRDFRDELLLTNPIGKTFVSIYYRTSPPIADALRENDGLRTVTRLTLITPLVYLSKFLLNSILAIGIFILGLTAVFLIRKERMEILRPLLVGTGSILVFIAAIFSLGFIGYAIPFCATVGAYMLPFVIPLSVVFTICTVLKMHVNVTDNIKKRAWNSKT